MRTILFCGYIMDLPGTRPQRSFCDLLGRVSPTIAARGGAILGAALGNLLKRADPAFSAEQYGANKLADLLLDCPEVGRVERDSSSNDILFVLAGADRLVPSKQPNPPRLYHPLWNALVSVRPRYGAFLDLGTARLVFTNPGNSPPGADTDGARFVAVEGIGQEEMREWAVEFAGIHFDELAAQNVRGLDVGVWFAEFTRGLPPGLRGPWQSVHAERVVARWRQWATTHDIDPEVGHTAPPRHPQPNRPQPPASGVHRASQLQSLRQLVHTAVDEMSEDELLALRVPLRYVIGHD